MTQTVGPQIPGLRFLEHLGSGGFAEVYLYERDQPRIKVAVKVMKTDVLDEGQRRLFVAEADVMAELAEHPFIVPVLGAGSTDEGRPYLVMRYYPPPDLGARVSSSPMSVADALRTGIQLASAIETAHRSGIIHRDIKPSNVLVSSYGVPGLSDFGIAGRLADKNDHEENLGVSVPWSPPEVLTGASNGSVTSDVYSLAATIWNLVVGRSPFIVKGGDNSDRALFGRILHGNPPSTGRADVPSSLERLLTQALSKNPAHRPKSALELARHLQRVEQELRLARTDIVVLDTSSEESSAPVAPSQSTLPTQEDSRTQVRRPRTGPTTNSAPPDINDSGGVTFVRPKRANTESGAAEQTALRGSVSPRSVATVHRPQSVPQTEPETTKESRGLPRPVLVGGVVTALIAVALGGVILFSKGNGKQEQPSTLPNGTAPTSIDQAIGALTPPDPPQISVRTNAESAIFTWPRSDPNDHYTYTIKGQAGDHVANEPKIILPYDGTQVCVMVYVHRDGTDPSTAANCTRP